MTKRTVKRGAKHNRSKSVRFAIDERRSKDRRPKPKRRRPKRTTSLYHDVKMLLFYDPREDELLDEDYSDEESSSTESMDDESVDRDSWRRLPRPIYHRDASDSSFSHSVDDTTRTSDDSPKESVIDDDTSSIMTSSTQELVKKRPAIFSRFDKYVQVDDDDSFVDERRANQRIEFSWPEKKHRTSGLGVTVKKIRKIIFGVKADGKAPINFNHFDQTQFKIKSLVSDPSVFAPEDEVEKDEDVGEDLQPVLSQSLPKEAQVDAPFFVNLETERLNPDECEADHPSESQPSPAMSQYETLKNMYTDLNKEKVKLLPLAPITVKKKKSPPRIVMPRVDEMSAHEESSDAAVQESSVDEAYLKVKQLYDSGALGGEVTSTRSRTPAHGQDTKIDFEAAKSRYADGNEGNVDTKDNKAPASEDVSVESSSQTLDTKKIPSLALSARKNFAFRPIGSAFVNVAKASASRNESSPKSNKSIGSSMPPQEKKATSRPPAPELLIANHRLAPAIPASITEDDFEMVKKLYSCSEEMRTTNSIITDGTFDSRIEFNNISTNNPAASNEEWHQPPLPESIAPASKKLEKTAIVAGSNITDDDFEKVKRLYSGLDARRTKVPEAGNKPSIGIESSRVKTNVRSTPRPVLDEAKQTLSKQEFPSKPALSEEDFNESIELDLVAVKQLVEVSAQEGSGAAAIHKPAPEFVPRTSGTSTTTLNPFVQESRLRFAGVGAAKIEKPSPESKPKKDKASNGEVDFEEVQRSYAGTATKESISSQESMVAVKIERPLPESAPRAKASNIEVDFEEVKRLYARTRTKGVVPPADKIKATMNTPITNKVTTPPTPPPEIYQAESKRQKEDGMYESIEDSDFENVKRLYATMEAEAKQEIVHQVQSRPKGPRKRKGKKKTLCLDMSSAAWTFDDIASPSRRNKQTADFSVPEFKTQKKPSTLMVNVDEFVDDNFDHESRADESTQYSRPNHERDEPSPQVRRRKTIRREKSKNKQSPLKGGPIGIEVVTLQ